MVGFLGYFCTHFITDKNYFGITIIRVNWVGRGGGGGGGGGGEQKRESPNFGFPDVGISASYKLKL